MCLLFRFSLFGRYDSILHFCKPTTKDRLQPIIKGLTNEYSFTIERIEHKLIK